MGCGVGVGVGCCVGVGVGAVVGVSVGVSTTVDVSTDVGVFTTAALLVFGVGVSVVATIELPYAVAAQIHSSSAAMSVPHPIPNFVFRERVRNQYLKPDGLCGGTL